MIHAFLSENDADRKLFSCSHGLYEVMVSFVLNKVLIVVYSYFIYNVNVCE